MEERLSARKCDIVDSRLGDPTCELIGGLILRGGILGIRPAGIAVRAAEVTAAEADKRGKLACMGALAVYADKFFYNRQHHFSSS